jgi:hypothetical protein
MLGKYSITELHFFSPKLFLKRFEYLQQEDRSECNDPIKHCEKFTKDIASTLAYKENEIQVLRNSAVQLK